MTTILVIEDDEQIRVSIVEVLSLNEFTVFEAENGLVGLELAKKRLPDLIICDINMPEMDGYDVLRRLRNEVPTATTPFIFLTAQTDRPHMRQGMDLGADDYLTKPFSWDELFTAIHSRLGRHALFIRENENKLDDLRGNILYSLPHELRTPLSGILASAELILDYGEKLERQKIISMAGTILESGERLHSLLENYLLFAQLEIIRSDPERIKTIRNARVENPQDVVIQIAKHCAALVQRESDLTFRPENMPTIRISSENLEKIALELVDNALKFSRQETPIEIEFEAADVFSLRIRDHGRGMTPEQIKNIAPYIQFDREIYEQQGSGMGLMIVRRLAELHGGHLHIESVPDQSTTVTVTLPLAKASK